MQVNANTKSFEDGDDDEEECNALNDEVDNYNDDANEQKKDEYNLIM